MAYHDIHHATASDVARRVIDTIGSVFSAIGRFLVSASVANRRVQLVEQLQSKSDAELSALNIRREDIVRRVFNEFIET